MTETTMTSHKTTLVEVNLRVVHAQLTRVVHAKSAIL